MRRNTHESAPTATVQTPPKSPSADGDTTVSVVRVKQQFRRAPKTRTGCITCKKRRVKCDETKPSCQRCSKGGFFCKGYATPKAWIFEASSRSPGSGDRSSGAEDLSDGTPPSTLDSILSLVTPYGTAQDTRGLSFFLRFTATNISCYSDPYFWNVLIPQASWFHPAIKHALVATSMMQQALPELHGEPAGPDHGAMTQYNRAIQALTRGPVCPPTEVVLITCVLFFTFDNLNGTTLTAQKHILSGLKVLEEWKQQEHVPLDASRTANNQMIRAYIVPVMAQALSYQKACMPAGEIEDVSLNAEPDPGSTENSSSSPPSIFRQSVETVVKHLQNNPTFHNRPFDSFDQAFSSLTACATLMKHNRTDPRAPRSTMTSLLQSWLELFESEASHVPSWPNERRMLLLHHESLSILAQFMDARSSASTPGELDQFNAGFRHIILEMRDLLTTSAVQNSRYYRSGPGLGLGLIAPLYIVGSQSANAVLRSEAITLLRSMKRREGRWTSHTAASICVTFGSILGREPDIARLARSRTGWLTAEVTLSRMDQDDDRQPQPWMRLVHRCPRTEKDARGSRKASAWVALGWPPSEIATVEWPINDVLQTHGYQPF